MSTFVENGIPVSERVIPLEKDDASKLAVAICRAARHFPIMHASQKYMDITALIVALASVYGPMVYLTLQRMQRPQQASPVANVYAFNA